MFSSRRSRRQFLAQTIALGTAWAVPNGVAPAADEPAVASCSPLVTTDQPLVRKSFPEFVKDKGMLADFRRGVACMRQLPPAHPFSWVFQANIHGRRIFPSYVYDQAARSTDPGQQLFRDDPRFIPAPNVFKQCTHGNWWFLPWHRAYVFFFERILRWACGNPRFALPYWNYSDPGQRLLPQEFRDAAVAGTPNPLYLPGSVQFVDPQGVTQTFLMRDPDVNAGTAALLDALVSPCALTRLPFSKSPPAAEGTCFGGQRASTPQTEVAKGAVEKIPHTTLHTFIDGFMLDFATAARDPIFWLHHCNIDRLWEDWLAHDATRMNPLDSEWLDQPFTFFDVVGGKPQAVTVQVCQLLDTKRQLGYQYDSPLTDLTGCPPAPSPSITAIVRLLATTTGFLNRQPGRGAIRLMNSASLSVPLPLLGGVRAGEIQSLTAALVKDSNGALALSLEQIQVSETPDVYFDVYFNLPGNDAPSPTDARYIDTLCFFGMKHPGAHAPHAAPPDYVRLAFPQALLKLIADQQMDVTKLVVTFVPRTGKKSVGNARLTPRPPRTPVRIGRIQLVQLR